MDETTKTLLRKFRQIYVQRFRIEAERLLETKDCVEWIDADLYRVRPVVYEVAKVNGRWLCECETFAQ